MGGEWINLLINVLKGITTVYDIVTFIPWYILGDPQGRLKQSNRIKVCILIDHLICVTCTRSVLVMHLHIVLPLL